MGITVDAFPGTWMRGALFACCGALASCSLVLATDDFQCKADSDCKRRGGGFVGSICQQNVCVDRVPGDADSGVDPVWGCLGNVNLPSAAKPQVRVSVPFVDLILRTSITNVTVTPCARLDVLCSSPIAPGLQVDVNGVATLTLAAGFDGYLKVDATSQTDAGVPAWIPSMVFFNPPLVDDREYGTIPLFSPASLSSLARANGNTMDPALGGAFSGALDCSGKPAAGVTWEPDRTGNGTKRFFYVEGLPSETAVATDASGYGGLINLPTGIVRLSATVQATGQAIGSASVLVREGFISYTYLVPSP